jgi:uncharacterized protein YegJ (DUF2314 family)
MFTGAAVIAAPIKKVIDEMKLFEKQPNRREPWTLQLQSRLSERRMANRLIALQRQDASSTVKYSQQVADRKDTYDFFVDDVQFL